MRSLTQYRWDSGMHQLGLELVLDRREMLEILTESKDQGTAVGICAHQLGEGIHVTAVEDILLDDSVTIVLRSYDATGYMLETNKLPLEAIEGVCPFQSRLENPYLRCMRHK